MLETVYVDLVASRSIEGIQSKAPFYPLFDSLKNQVDKKIIVFTNKPVDEAQISTVMVETGENRTLPETRNFVKWLNGYLDSVIQQPTLVR